jgi:hypothetical protein
VNGFFVGNAVRGVPELEQGTKQRNGTEAVPYEIGNRKGD